MAGKELDLQLKEETVGVLVLEAVTAQVVVMLGAAVMNAVPHLEAPGPGQHSVE